MFNSLVHLIDLRKIIECNPIEYSLSHIQYVLSRCNQWIHKNHTNQYIQQPTIAITQHTTNNINTSNPITTIYNKANEPIITIHSPIRKYKTFNVFTEIINEYLEMC